MAPPKKKTLIDVKDLESHLIKNEELYERSENLLDRIDQPQNNKKIQIYPQNIKSIIELINAMSGIRAKSIDGSYKLNQLKVDSANNNEDGEIMRKINEIQASIEEKDYSKVKSSVVKEKIKVEKESFEDFIQKKVEEGELSLSENDVRALNEYSGNKTFDEDDDD